MFVPDLLHEFELGVWKAIFKHLIRILYARGDDSIQMLNDRYVNHPTFTAQLCLTVDLVDIAAYLLLGVGLSAVFMQMRTQ